MNERIGLSSREGGESLAIALAAIVDSSSDAVITKSLDGIIRTWNGGARIVYGAPASTMIGQSIERIIPDAERRTEAELRRRVSLGESVSGHHGVRQRVGGKSFDVVMSMSPVRDDSGTVIAVASISRPLSLDERDASRFAALLEAAPDAIIGVDRDGTIGATNAQAAILFGYEREELLGLPFRELLPEEVRTQHEQHVEAFQRNPQTRTMGIGLALTARRRDGTVFPVEISLAPDISATDGYVIAAVRDVTDRSRLEVTARENAIRLRQLAESVETMFILMTIDPPEVLYISPASRVIFGREPNEFEATDDPIGLVVHPEDRERVTLGLLVDVYEGRPSVSEHRAMRVDGEVRWVRVVNQPVPSVDGAPDRAVITVEDITERVLVAATLAEAENVARLANDAKNHFLSRMSHELRTPLNAVLGFGQLLQYELADTTHIDAVNQIVKGGRHLLNLINDVLDIARIEAGEMSISSEPVLLADLIEETIQLMEPLALAAGVTVSVESMGGEANTSVLADRQRLRQVLLNLLSNAIKYNRRGGRVWVESAVTTDQVAISVWDDGPGIPDELRSRLFTPFDRLGADARGVDGTGIGLALTRSLTELMGGVVTVSPPGEQGVGFVVALPRADSQSIHDRPLGMAGSADHSRPQVPVGSKTVLYIEDNDPNVRVVESVIALRPEWRIIHAGLGGLGIDLAVAHVPDLILLDLHLPDRSGADVLASLRAESATSGIPVVVVTADATSTLPRRILQSGARKVLTKPFDLEDLLAVLDEYASPRSDG